MIRFLRFLLFLPLLTAVAEAGSKATVGHQIDLIVDPGRGTLAATDTMTLPPERGDWTFYLHRGLEPRITGGDAELKPGGREGHLERYRLQVRGPSPVTLRYAGSIQHELEEVREGMGRSRQQSRGTIAEDGVVLDGYSGWYPHIPDTLQTFRLSVQLPSGWSAVSQGAGPDVSSTRDGVRVGWREDQPQDDIYLIAAPFERYATPTSSGEAQVYLREPDPALAERYLTATGEYLDLYSRLIGPYPYAKFALVENFWETGYGMPSFTLLGPRVIRLPFIVHTSYPHEVLHNWWGNGVYVDYASGNWSEGLTAYLADHLLRERQGQGADYRRDTLKAYADYVREGKDFPIRDFRGRHGSASQAIGYGKTLMLLHMLRRDLGDPVFVAGLRRFYRDNLFRAAGFDDLRLAFEQESGRDLTNVFAQWTGRVGAPELTLSDVTAARAGGGFRLRGRLGQTQQEAPFPLTVPLVIHLEGGGISEHAVPLSGRAADFDLTLPARPLRVAADPRFDLFRRLVPGESPATLSALFGAEGGLIVLPSAAPNPLENGYRQLAAAWMHGSLGWELIADTELETLPDDRPIWLLGWSNRFLRALAKADPTSRLDPETRSIYLAGEELGGEATSVALVSEREGAPVGWVAAGNADALPGLARKLPHYGKYSYLAFEGQAPENRLKGQWPARDSRLTAWLTEERPAVEVLPGDPLTALLE
jgi:hypothetical protein